MYQVSSKIKSFTDLHAWQVGHQLVLEIYRVTRAFPKEETFGLTNQIRRCAVSITSNIAEGFSRQSKKEKIQFNFMSLGSVTELQNQLVIARDISYIDHQTFEALAQMSISVHKLVNGLIKSLRTQA